MPWASEHGSGCAGRGRSGDQRENRLPLHLIKLCVGAESVVDLHDWITEVTASGAEQVHTTRMVPKRADELLDGGSLYWVIRGAVQARQRLVDIRPFTGDDGIGRCHLVLDPALVETQRQPRRPFQGWRYLDDKDVPRDLAAGISATGDEMPAELRAELMELGLL